MKIIVDTNIVFSALVCFPLDWPPEAAGSKQN